MSPLEQQFEILKVYEPEAAMNLLPNGSHLISIPNLRLPAGWSKSITEVKFIAPTGYPLARPDCFWTDVDLRIANGNMPKNAQNNPIPHVTSSHLWFSWHLSSWNPNSDNLLTYLNVIKRRLHHPI